MAFLLVNNMSMTHHVEKTCILYFQICIFHVFQVALIRHPLETFVWVYVCVDETFLWASP